MNTTEKERDKYSRIWEFEDYGNSPGLKWADKFWEIAKPFPNALLIDVGAGSGAATQELKKRGLDVEAFDITGIGWKQNDIRLKLGCLWRDKLDQHFDYAYCCDVMEHIPTQFVGLVLDNILSSASYCFFSISFFPDQMGKLIGETLHLTVKPFTWWRDTLSELCTVVDARDMIGEGIFYVRK